MTTDRQRAANRANARKSTGPKSARGKRAAGQNAVKHGLTRPPPLNEVLRWVRIYLEDATVTMADLGEDPLSRAVLDLTQAEAQLERAYDAERRSTAELARYARTDKERDPRRLAADGVDLDDPAVLTFLLGRPLELEAGMSHKEKEKAKKVHEMDQETFRILLARSRGHLKKRADELERLQRYIRAAERRKREAFNVWFAARAEAADQNLQNEANF
ncbi:hypothetical protein P1J78_12520 [Psychromarinibacter sp. C21-152]|uniref:Uncharacterized protein n=1 Tax=Psychromarinibacter sediminicola TaxID=3033385 RepID=A0AAE3NT70_9RHOB|nr:hypothetical protein [Psychromarinibacter sediminicola]MDF0601561.1 hypothetical protein [Psychromarinibacter sediminicola]